MSIHQINIHADGWRVLHFALTGNSFNEVVPFQELNIRLTTFYRFRKLFYHTRNLYVMHTAYTVNKY